MSPSELEEQLRAWGRIYGEGPPRDDDDRPGPAVHPIAVAMEHAPRHRSTVIRMRTHMDRGGQGRRRLMAVAAGVERLNIVPASYVDPIPCKASRGGGRGARPISAEMQRLNRAILDLQELHPMRGLCLRVHYCVWGTLEHRAAEASRRLGQDIHVRSYRDAVREAKLLLGLLLQIAA